MKRSWSIFFCRSQTIRSRRREMKNDFSISLTKNKPEISFLECRAQHFLDLEIASSWKRRLAQHRKQFVPKFDFIPACFSNFHRKIFLLQLIKLIKLLLQANVGFSKIKVKSSTFAKTATKEEKKAACADNDEVSLLYFSTKCQNNVLTLSLQSCCIFLSSKQTF